MFADRHKVQTLTGRLLDSYLFIFLTADCCMVEVSEFSETEKGQNDPKMQSLTRTLAPEGICSHDDQEDSHLSLKTNISKAGGTSWLVTLLYISFVPN